MNVFAIIFQNNLDQRSDSGRRRDENALSNNDLVLSHAVTGFIDLADLVNEDIIYR